jgi:hypothetical protein
MPFIILSSGQSGFSDIPGGRVIHAGSSRCWPLVSTSPQQRGIIRDQRFPAVAERNAHEGNGNRSQLRVPEVWRYDGQRMTMYQLQPEGRYRACETSLSFPGLQPADVERFIEMGRTTAKRQWAWAIREWVRNELIPRRNPAGPPG